MGDGWRSERLLDASADDDIREVAAVLGEVQDLYPWKPTMPAREQVNTLYAREWAAENGYHGIGENAEELLDRKTYKNLNKWVGRAVGGIISGGATAVASGGEAAAAVSVGALGGAVTGNACWRYHGGDEGIPLDVDGTRFFNDPVEALREELDDTYSIDTYGTQTVVPRRYE